MVEDVRLTVQVTRSVRCRCMGIDRRTRCDDNATQEDGYCDGCRCPHGACDGHGDFEGRLFFDDPEQYMVKLGEAFRLRAECNGSY